MKISIKNILMITAVLLLFGGTVFTMYYAKNNISVTQNSQNLKFDNSNIGEPPERPDGSTSGSNMGEPPEKPNGEMSGSNSSDTGGLPEMPSGDNNFSNQNMPQNNFDNQNKELTAIYYIAFGIEGLLISILIIYLFMSKFNKSTFKETFVTSNKTIIAILLTVLLTGVLTYGYSIITSNYFLNNNSTTENNKTNTQTSNSVKYASPNEITESKEISEGTYFSNSSDENAVLVSGDIDVTISNVIVNKTGDSDGGDSTSFYGNNSAVIAKGGANLVLKNLTVTTNSNGANGVFSYGGSATTNNSSNDGTTITISDSKIITTKDNSGGIMTTGGGVTKASNLTINTSGTSSAAIRTDRGGGTVTVDGGTYTTAGQGSPTIYSTADITVSNSNLLSGSSEGIIIEGANSVIVNNCNLTDSNTKLNGQSTTYKNIFLYQSMSGDADNGSATFTAKDSTINTNKGDEFYITNTTAIINLTNNTFINNDSTGNFLRAQKDSWGTSGSNGGNVTLNMNNQKVNGNIVIDSISTLNMVMNTSSTYKGSINNNNTAKSIVLKLDKASKITLTGDSYVTNLDDEDTSYSNIDFNGYKLYVNGNSINQ